jgi:hypothetical protein
MTAGFTLFAPARVSVIGFFSVDDRALALDDRALAVDDRALRAAAFEFFGRRAISYPYCQILRDGIGKFM